MDKSFSQTHEKDELISRRAAIDAVYKCTDYYVGNLPVMIDKADAYKALADLPTVDAIADAVAAKMQTTVDVPDKKIGKWLERQVFDGKVIEEWQTAKCSICGLYHTTPYLYSFYEYEFCPYCGERMKGAGDGND